MLTQLIIGCRRKVVIYSWKDGEAQEIKVRTTVFEPFEFIVMLSCLKEAVLPHSPRLIAFLDHDNACFAYSPTDYAVFSISKLTTIDVVLPVATTVGAFSGLGNYMMLGLGAKAKPNLVRLNDDEALVVKDSTYKTILHCLMYLDRPRPRFSGRH